MDMAAKARGRIIERGKAVARRRVEQPRQHGPAFAVERDHRVGGIVASGRRHDFQLCRHAAILASRRSPRAPILAFKRAYVLQAALDLLSAAAAPVHSDRRLEPTTRKLPMQHTFAAALLPPAIPPPPP